MNILLIYFSSPELIMPTLPLGLVCVATAVKREGHAVKLVEISSGSDPLPDLRLAVEEFPPDAIGLSVRNIDNQAMQGTQFLLEPLKKIVAACRELTAAPVLLGGAGYSMYPERILEYLGADIGIRGDGELALPAVLGHLNMKADVTLIKGVYIQGLSPHIKSCFARDLRGISAADPSLWLCAESERPGLWMPFQTRRGCPLGCSYCSTASIEGTSLRQRPVKAAVDNLALHAAAGFTRFYCTDNTFNLPAGYAEDFCRALSKARLNITWSCIVYPYRVKEALVSAMAEAGCAEISLGFESGSEPMLRSMGKRYCLEDVRHAAELFARCGIRQNGYLLLGGPGETKESVLESLSFADSLPLASGKITTGIRIYPHTALAQTALGQAVIRADDDLLFPKFYLARGLSGWIDEAVEKWMAARPHWHR